MSQAFGAIEINKVTNDDGSIHVSEMRIDGALFHFHEEVDLSSTIGPEKYKGVTTIIGLMVADVDTVMNRATKYGSILEFTFLVSFQIFPAKLSSFSFSDLLNLLKIRGDEQQKFNPFRLGD